MPAICIHLSLFYDSKFISLYISFTVKNQLFNLFLSSVGSSRQKKMEVKGSSEQGATLEIAFESFFLSIAACTNVTVIHLKQTGKDQFKR